MSRTIHILECPRCGGEVARWPSSDARGIRHAHFRCPGCPTVMQALPPADTPRLAAEIDAPGKVFA